MDGELSGVVSQKEGVGMNVKYIFPAIIIMLQVGASAVYAIGGDVRMCVYWAAASVVNLMATVG